jgi:hypothetical protein
VLRGDGDDRCGEGDGHWRSVMASGRASAGAVNRRAEQRKGRMRWAGLALVKTGEGRWAKAKRVACAGGLMG